MRVKKREFAREFSQLWCAGQTRMRVDESWEARVCTRVLSTLMRRSNEDESRWELRSESLHESSLNSHAPVKRGESWWELTTPDVYTQSLKQNFVNIKFCWLRLLTGPLCIPTEIVDKCWLLQIIGTYLFSSTRTVGYLLLSCLVGWSHITCGIWLKI